ncbi:MAG: hypothetical protein FWD22_04205 [Treponema sp.]|nr:hypothetical protein [Treponema sp.]
MENEKYSLMHLDLRQDILFVKTNLSEADFSAQFPKNGEFLLCYKLNPMQSRSIEPDLNQFLEELAFFGEKAEADVKIDGQELVKLAAGHYLFTQCRAEKPLNKEEWLDLAIEQQKDGLWERNKLADLLYIRFLFEDEQFVTQILRPVA